MVLVPDTLPRQRQRRHIVDSTPLTRAPLLPLAVEASMLFLLLRIMELVTVVPLQLALEHLVVAAAAEVGSLQHSVMLPRVGLMPSDPPTLLRQRSTPSVDPYRLQEQEQEEEQHSRLGNSLLKILSTPRLPRKLKINFNINFSSNLASGSPLSRLLRRLCRS
jgi:hypothetical protein